MSYVSTAVSVAFYMLGMMIPIGFQLALVGRRSPAEGRLSVQERLQSAAQDMSVAAFVCWLAYILEPAAPRSVSAVLCVLVGIAGFLASLDAALMRVIGARLEPQLLSYASDLNTIGGSRWRLPAFGALVLGVLAALAAWETQGMLPCMPAFVLFGLSCLFVPMLVWARKAQSTSLWRIEGPLWHWVHIGIIVPLVGLRRAASATGPAAVCIVPEERYTLHDPAYPLWRNTHSWGGVRTVPWSMPKNHKPHVIVIVMESMGAMETSCIGKHAGVTPCFDAWSQKGALYTRHYATGHSTSRSLMSALYGVLPGLRARPTIADENPAYLSGMPQLFAAHGYHTRYMQGASTFFDDKETYFLERGFDEVLGADALFKLYPDAETGAWSAPHDAYLFDAHAAWLLEKHQSGEPTFSTLLTITNHHPWEIPRAWRTGELADPALYAAQIANEDPKVVRERARLATRYADAQLGIYLDRLDKAGVLGQSIVLIFGDTGEQHEDEQISTQVGGYLRDEAYHVPLLLLAPQYLDKPKLFEHVTSQIDVLPTLMDLMGWHGPHHSMGQSLARPAQRRNAYFTQPHSPSLLSLRCDQWRMNAGMDGLRTSLYDIEKDPLERSNLAAAEALRVEVFRKQMMAIQDTAMRMHQQHAFCPPVDGRSAHRMQHLAEAVYNFAPEGMRIPQTMAELQAIVESPQYADDKKLLSYKKLVLRVMRAELSPEDRLTFMQYHLQALYTDSFGEMEWRAFADYTRLYNVFIEVEQEQETRLYEQVQEALQRTPKLGG